MQSLGWILLFCAAVSVTLAGFCTVSCPDRRTCTKSWWRTKCRTVPCTRKDCCLGWGGASCTADIDECKEGHHGCTHKCTNTQGSYYCSCYAGYYLGSDRKTCIKDVDECKGVHHGCSHGCTNTVGSYICTCPSGLILDSDRKTCKGHWCPATYACYKTCSSRKKNCTKRWWRTKCSYYTVTFRCTGACSTKKCCAGWKGNNCHLPIGKIDPAIPTATIR